MTEHFARGSEALETYRPAAWSSGARPPRCTAVWVRRAVGEALSDRDREALIREVGSSGRAECE